MFAANVHLEERTGHGITTDSKHGPLAPLNLLYYWSAQLGFILYLVGVGIPLAGRPEEASLHLGGNS